MPSTVLTTALHIVHVCIDLPAMSTSANHQRTHNYTVINYSLYSPHN